jgi:hypothetical protein
LMSCLPNMPGKETMARIHGTVLSILFALLWRCFVSNCVPQYIRS